jgi:RES domain-containing protein
LIITAWRIVSQKHGAEAFSGSGASLYPGRWNRRNVPMVYTSESISLAALEMMVHLDGIILHQPFVCIPVEFDKRDVTELKTGTLPSGWNGYPCSDVTRKLGSDWIQSGHTAVLKVPSAVIPMESNYLLNPNHSHFHRIKIGKSQGFRFDQRLR